MRSISLEYPLHYWLHGEVSIVWQLVVLQICPLRCKNLGRYIFHGRTPSIPLIVPNNPGALSEAPKQATEFNGRGTCFILPPHVQPAILSYLAIDSVFIRFRRDSMTSSIMGINPTIPYKSAACGGSLGATKTNIWLTDDTSNRSPCVLGISHTGVSALIPLQ